MPTPSNGTLNIQSRVVKERSPLRVSTYQIDAANLVAWKALWDTFVTATIAICAGTVRDEGVYVYDQILDAAIPTDNFARRELKMLIRYVGDTTGSVHKMEFPCPDLDVLTMESGDANYVNIADAGVMAAWVAAFEAFARSPDDDTESVTIQSAQVKGRNI